MACKGIGNTHTANIAPPKSHQQYNHE